MEDNGPGIPEDQQPRLLERFARLAENASHGSGLGLAIAREIAEQHGGQLTLGRSGLGGLKAVLSLSDPSITKTL